MSVLIISDPERAEALSCGLADVDPRVAVVTSDGGDAVVELFLARQPAVVIVSATLQRADAQSVISTLRGLVERGTVGVVVVGDEHGPIRTEVDAAAFAPDGFVSWPVSHDSLRTAVRGVLDARVPKPSAADDVLGDSAVAQSSAREGWKPLADVLDESDEAAMRAISTNDDSEPEPLPPLFEIRPRRDPQSIAEIQTWDAPPPASAARSRDSTLVIRAPDPDPPPPPTEEPRVRTPTSPPPIPAIRSRGMSGAPFRTGATPATASAEDDWSEPTPLSEVVERLDHSGSTGLGATPGQGVGRWVEHLGSAEVHSTPDSGMGRWVDHLGSAEVRSTPDSGARRWDDNLGSAEVRSTPDSGARRWDDNLGFAEVRSTPDSGARRRDDNVGSAEVRSTADSGARRWVDNLGSAEVRSTPDSGVRRWIDRPAMDEELPIVGPLDGLDLDQKIVSASPMYDVGEFDDPDLIVPTPVPSRAIEDDPGSGQDFARQLRAKMSLMAQRLFHSEAGAVERGNGEPRGYDRGDAHLAPLGPELQLDRVDVTTIARVNFERRERAASASPVGSWGQSLEREFSDAGELERGVSDAAIVLAKTFARKTTGRVAFRHDDIEKIVFFDAGRPVFASSNAPGDRMGELLVREGKITAAQYDRCQADVVRTGRRIGEILVDFGYLKRRELLPAVRRHVEDIVFSLFGWTGGRYQVMPDPAASTERIRMSRHAASLILEGIRRKLDRATLERLVGPASTIIDIVSRERLNTMVNASDLVEEERAALAAFDGRADLASVARTAGVDVADVLPLAWGLCVLELAAVRRIEIEDPSAALVGETDLAIDRERIRARWNLVTEADYFALLGVRRDATGFEIRRAYQSARRDFAAENFPIDVRREFSRELADIATVLDEAFRVMRDDKLRPLYRSHLPDSEIR